MVYKSFFRKKTTHIYLFILFLLVFIFSLLIVGKQYYINVGNQDYNGSYLVLTTEKDIEKELKTISDIKNIRKGFYYEEVYFLESKIKLLENEIIIPKEYKQDISIKSEIEFGFNGTQYTFIVKDYNSEYKIFYINNSFFEELKKQTKTKAYILDIKNWANNENVVKKLSKNIDNDITIHINKESNINYENIIIFFNSFIILNIFLFLIVLIITIFNILEDEKKNNLMYRNIGFSQKQIIKTNILKVIFLLLLVFIFNSIIIYIILKNINI